MLRVSLMFCQVALQFEVDSTVSKEINFTPLTNLEFLFTNK